MKRVRLHVDAERELAEAFDFYEGERQGVGVRFLRLVRAKLTIASRLPGIARTRMIGGHEVRCVVARRFPYVIFFVEHENEIFVVAIAHTRRAPGYWAQRLRG